MTESERNEIIVALKEILGLIENRMLPVGICSHDRRLVYAASRGRRLEADHVRIVAQVVKPELIDHHDKSLKTSVTDVAYGAGIFSTVKVFIRFSRGNPIKSELRTRVFGHTKNTASEHFLT